MIPAINKLSKAAKKLQGGEKKKQNKSRTQFSSIEELLRNGFIKLRGRMGGWGARTPDTRTLRTLIQIYPPNPPLYRSPSALKSRSAEYDPELNI